MILIYLVFLLVIVIVAEKIINVYKDSKGKCFLTHDYQEYNPISTRTSFMSTLVRLDIMALNQFRHVVLCNEILYMFVCNSKYMCKKCNHKKAVIRG